MCFHVHGWHMSQYCTTTLVFSLIGLGGQDHFLHNTKLTLCILLWVCCFKIFTKPSHTHSLELLLMNSDILHFFDHTCTPCRLSAKSLSPYLKGRDLHLTSEITLYFMCVFQKSPWSTPQLWWAAQRNQQVSIRALCTSPISTAALWEEQKHII